MNFTNLTIGALLAALLSAAAPAHASARSTVKVVNESSRTIVAIHSSPRYRSSYGDTDLLGSHVLRSGYHIYVDFDTRDAEDECWQDVIAEGTGGTRWKKTMNICREASWTLVD